MKIQPKAVYAVKLTRVVRFGKFTYKPLNELEMVGAAVSAIIEAEGEGVFQYVNKR